MIRPKGAANLGDLWAPPGNRLETLKADRAGQHSIRINNQFWICFLWTPEGPAAVEITDYHRGGKRAMSKRLPPMHPGEVLREEFLLPLSCPLARGQEDGRAAHAH